MCLYFIFIDKNAVIFRIWSVAGTATVAAAKPNPSNSRSSHHFAKDRAAASRRPKIKKDKLYKFKNSFKYQVISNDWY